MRKTAALCVAKLYDMNQAMVTDHGFLDNLRALVEDGNPMVVANAVAALSEIQVRGLWLVVLQCGNEL